MDCRRVFRTFARLAYGAPIFALALASVPAQAQVSDAPPDPGVARVSLLAGSVDVKRADSGDTVAAAVNAPLSAGDYLTTDSDSHAEVQFDHGTALRIAADTQLRFTELGRDHDLQLAAGTVDLRVFRADGIAASIQTPQATVRPNSIGSTFVSVDEDGNTQVTVRSGHAALQTQTVTQTLMPGSTVTISGDAAAPVLTTVATAGYGAFDRFVATRDRAFEQLSDYRYLDAGMIGADDLARNGRWIEYPRYGDVWVPAVAPGWAPYRDGRFVWEPYYGWTWVANEPWGWAPFHYGNWFYAAGTGWAWYPGSFAVARPCVYRPALVAFFSFGGGGLSLGFGNVGWVPIAPFEPFHPWWGSTIVNTTTIVNTYNITKVYQNASVPNGANGTSNRFFGTGNFSHVRPLEPGEVARVEPVRGVVPIVPTAHNLGFSNHESVHPIEPGVRFATFKKPSVAGPSFTQQQTAVRDEAIRAFPRHAGAIGRPQQAGLDRAPAAFALPGRTAAPVVDPFSRFAPTARIHGPPVLLEGGRPTARPAPPGFRPATTRTQPSGLHAPVGVTAPLDPSLERRAPPIPQATPERAPRGVTAARPHAERPSSATPRERPQPSEPPKESGPSKSVPFL